MKIHINYAHGSHFESQKKCCETALSHGGFDTSIPYGLKDVDPEFVEKNSYTFYQPRGAGCWVWKPYIILKTMETMNPEDWLMYTDSGMFFVKNPWEWILSMNDKIGDRGIITFGNCGTNRQFTKRDAFILMGADTPKYTDSPQRMASVFVCRRTDFSMSFVKEWLRYATFSSIITDLPNRMGEQNYPEFRDHRHDQSIMSILSYRYGTYVEETDITQFSNPDPYIFHSRTRN